MTTLREAAQQALEALEGADEIDCDMRDAITALRTALAEPEQEPVAWRDPRIKSPGQGCTYDKAKHDIWPHLYPEPLYTHPDPQRKPLSDEDIVDLWADVSMDYDDQINIIEMARAIERAHGIGGEA